MIKNLSRAIATLMLFIGIVFLVYAFNHPEMSFPWNNTITYMLYVLYAIVVIVLYIAPFNVKRKDENK